MLNTDQFVVIIGIIAALTAYAVFLIHLNDKYKSEIAFYQATCQMLSKQAENEIRYIPANRVVKLSLTRELHPDAFGHYLPAKDLAVDELLESARDYVSVKTYPDLMGGKGITLDGALYIVEPKEEDK